jgi:CBS domain-containing protein
VPVETNLRNTRVRHLDLSSSVCVDRAAPLAAVVARMREEVIGCVLVCEEDRVIGIFTERDLLLKVVGQGVDYDAPVGEYMSPDPTSLGPDALLGDAIAKMSGGGYRNLPLVGEDGKVSKLLTARDVIRYIGEHFPREILDLPPEGQRRFDSPEGA